MALLFVLAMTVTLKLEERKGKKKWKEKMKINVGVWSFHQSKEEFVKLAMGKCLASILQNTFSNGEYRLIQRQAAEGCKWQLTFCKEYFMKTSEHTNKVEVLDGLGTDF